MNKLKIGSLFSGFAGLDRAVMDVFDAEVAWHSEIEPAAVKVLDHHWPNVPNLGDITKVDWTRVEPVDIVCGGSPCQDISDSGKKAGMVEGTRSNLWVEMREAIAALKPSIVVWENVRGAFTAQARSLEDGRSAGSGVELGEGLLGDGSGRPALRALGRVLGDLSDLGFDAEWGLFRASDVGAPHGRARVFVVAYAEGVGFERGWPARDGRAGLADGDRGDFRAPMTLLPTPTAQDSSASGGSSASNVTLTDATERTLMGTIENVRLLPTPRASRGGSQTETMYALGAERDDEGDRQGNVTLDGDVDFGEYRAAVELWASLTYPAPPPTIPDGKGGRHRLNAAFAEWMMGAPEGHFTDPAIGITRREQLKLAGNGVVRQQAAEAIRQLIGRVGS